MIYHKTFDYIFDPNSTPNLGTYSVIVASIVIKDSTGE